MELEIGFWFLVSGVSPASGGEAASLIEGETFNRPKNISWEFVGAVFNRD